jgi:hypothetical protein
MIVQLASPYLKQLVAGFPRRRPGSAPGSGKWDLWWTKWRRGRFSPSTSVSPAKTIHSTNFSIITIIRGSWQRPCDELITDPRSPADCPRSSNRNEMESFMEAAKAQNWAVEPQGKK